MPSGHFTHIEDIAPEDMDEGDGWLITEFRLPFSDREGLDTTMFHARFNPGAVHKRHRHERCEEIYYVISGRGIAGAGGATEDVRAGHFHFVPADTEHWLVNASDTEPIEVIGWYLGAGSVAATGYVYMGDVSETDLHAPRRRYDVGALTNLADVDPSDMDLTNGWRGSEYRLCLGAAEGIDHSAWHAVLASGRSVERHKHAEGDEFLLVVSGSGRIGVGDETVELRQGTCVHVPTGSSQWIEASSDESLIIIGLHDRHRAH